MSIYDKQKEIINLVDEIRNKLHSLTDTETASKEDLSEVQKQIGELNEKVIVLKYSLEIEENQTIDEQEHVIESSEQPVEVEEIIESPDEIEAEEADMESEEEEEAVFAEEEQAETEEETNYNQWEEELEEEYEEEAQEEEELPPLSSSEDSEQPNILEEDIVEVLDELGSAEEIANVQDINESFSEGEGASVGEHLERQPIVDLLPAIGLNERYHYANELFEGDMEDFKKTVQLLNDFDDGMEAKNFFENELLQQYSWEREHELVQALYQLVERRYL